MKKQGHTTVILAMRASVPATTAKATVPEKAAYPEVERYLVSLGVDIEKPFELSLFNNPCQADVHLLDRDYTFKRPVFGPLEIISLKISTLRIFR